jgi:hypothetical protein
MSYKRLKQSRRSKKSKLSKKQLYGIAVITVIAVSSLAIYAFFTQGSSNEFKAAIVDQLSSRADFQNATFVKTANATLTAAGYAVTYYKGSDVNVNFYRGLPTYGYKIIIFRVHSALRYDAKTGNLTAPLDLFTSEPYSHDYAFEQERGYLDIAMYQLGGDQFFGILNGFVSNAMQGRFQNTTIILMGCNGLDIYNNGTATLFRSLDMLNAFISKGAKVVIGWDTAVDMQRTDSATVRLLQHLLLDDQRVKDAVNSTNKDVGSDSVHGSVLRYFPSMTLGSLVDVGNYTIPIKTKSITTNMNSESTISFGATGVFALPIFLSERPVIGRFRRLIF